DLDIAGTSFRMTREDVEHFIEGQRVFDAHLAALGQLAWSFTALDQSVDRLFEPLLQCSPEQVACMMVENISTRCTQLILLLHLEARPSQFRDWTEKLLNRVSNELAGERNRYLHDSWVMHWGGGQEAKVTRTIKRPHLAAPQARKPKKITFNRRVPVTLPLMQNLASRMDTVSLALGVAGQNLETWRQKGRLPRLNPQWLPASKPKALGRWDGSWSAELPQPPPPARYE
ncbi:MAG: hypothetical protein ACXU7G_08220, partial [Croceibacterium sp.]